jgi:acyl-coenzyme A thioesterase PaaI-like protein
MGQGEKTVTDTTLQPQGVTLTDVASAVKKQPTSRMCFVCGESNPAGVHVRFYEQEDGSVLARFTGCDHHQGYPGRMHGGIITAVMDETMGRAIMTRYGDNIWGVTAELNVRFRQPVPLNVELTAVGRITEEKKRLFEGSGELYLPDGSVAVEAVGKFVKMDLSRIATFDPEREQWYVRPD